MKSMILTDKAIREIILSLRVTSQNRTREKEREYLRQLIVRMQNQVGTTKKGARK